MMKKLIGWNVEELLKTQRECAIKRTIRNFEKMIALAENLPQDGVRPDWEILTNAGLNPWKYPLCELYYSLQRDCFGCVFGGSTHACYDSPSAWRDMANSQNWGGFVIFAGRMLERLKAELEEDSSWCSSFHPISISISNGEECCGNCKNNERCYMQRKNKED